MINDMSLKYSREVYLYLDKNELKIDFKENIPAFASKIYIGNSNNELDLEVDYLLEDVIILLPLMSVENKVTERVKELYPELFI